ncbi:MAG: hypothetical protein H0W50_04385 [Parachlamydiaceae bacterium]|nr:hypothetical protein [Parachlamydiaceae bacterium]
MIDKKIPGAEKAKINFDADPDNKIHRENLEKAREIFERPIASAMKAREAVEMGKDIIFILKHFAWTKKDHELLSEIERFLTPGVFLFTDQLSTDVEMIAMNQMIANVALDKMYFSEKKSYAEGNPESRPEWIAPYFAHALQITESRLKEQDCFNKLEQKSKFLKNVVLNYRRCLAGLTINLV